MSTNTVSIACTRLGFKLSRVPISKPASFSGVGHRWDITDHDQHVIASGRNPTQAYYRLRLFLRPDPLR